MPDDNWVDATDLAGHSNAKWVLFGVMPQRNFIRFKEPFRGWFFEE